MPKNKDKYELNDENLEQVNGGNYDEMHQSFLDLQELGVIPENVTKQIKSVEAAFQDFGVVYVHGFGSNPSYYYHSCQAITREQAIDIVKKALGK